MITLALLALLQAPADAATFEDPAKEIQWSRTFDEAFELASLRNVPVWIFLTSDN
jgi:hypothetical protein